jgi:hypothetical protein
MRKRHIPGALPEPSDPGFGTRADIRGLTAAEALFYMREDFAGAHKRFPQYRGWELEAGLGIMRRPVLFRGRRRAEKNDLVLVSGSGEFLKVYVPRIGHHCMIAASDIEMVAL